MWKTVRYYLLRGEVPGTDLAALELFSGSTEDRGDFGEDAMWISLFTLACGAAVCLGVVAVMMERGGQQLLRR